MASKPGQSPAAPAPTSSAQAIAEVAREKQLAVLASKHSLDTKASTLLGFVGIVLSLIFGSDTARDNWCLTMSIGAGLLTVSAIPLGYVLLPRKIKLNPDIGSLRRLTAGRSADTTYTAIAASIERGISYNENQIRRPARVMKLSAVAVALSVMIIGASLVYSLQTS